MPKMPKSYFECIQSFRSPAVNYTLLGCYNYYQHQEEKGEPIFDSDKDIYKLYPAYLSMTIVWNFSSK